MNAFVITDRRRVLKHGTAALLQFMIGDVGLGFAQTAKSSRQAPGKWIKSHAAEILPVHAALTYDPSEGPGGRGRVILLSGYMEDEHRWQVWTPDAGAIPPISQLSTLGTQDSDTFCGGHSTLSDGRLLVTGGTKRTRGSTGSLAYPDQAGTYDTYILEGKSWRSADLMHCPRWYPTCVALPDRRIVVISGWTAKPKDDNSEIAIAEVAEFYDVERNKWDVIADDHKRLPLYPRVHVVPSGKVFYMGSGTMEYDCGLPPHLLDPRTGKWIKHSRLNDEGNYGSYLSYGSSFIYLSFDGRGALTSKSKIVLCGGGGKTEWQGSSDPSFHKRLPVEKMKATSEIVIYPIDPKTGEPKAPVRDARNQLSEARRHHTCTFLPTGEVLISGGVAADLYESPVLDAEIFEPESNMSRPAGRMSVGRGYHSCATLLQDGSVATFGTGNPFETDACNAQTGDMTKCHLELQTEVYHPSFFGRSRPRITKIQLAHEGSRVLIFTEMAHHISYITLIHPGSSTHGFNPDQRCLRLTPEIGQGYVKAIVPGRNCAIPGLYLAFVVDTHGVPSAGHWVSLNA